ncbi:hypothetical protein [uncultured Brachyspira sp.]|uniref:hypothetical protein n=1 Tax=uncultured Brachyspira sp. TaxID=221953 RepID=UPI0025E60FFA|nr:hypothetical protein [uncultured Brachyspira sp.]
MIKRTFALLLIYAFLFHSKHLFSVSSKHSLSVLETSSTRSRGMMNSGFLTGNDSSAVFLNSSSLMNVLRDSINLNYTLSSNPENEYIFNASYAHIGASYAVGIGFASEINKIYSYDNFGIKKNNIYNGLYLINLSAAYAVSEGSFIGANIKSIINNSRRDNNFGMFFDLSYMQSVFTPNFKLGMVIRNFGFYDNVFAKVDTEITASLAYIKSDNSFSISAQYTISVPSVSHNASLGLEAMIVDFNKLGLFEEKTAWYDDLPEEVLDKKRFSSKLPSGILARVGVGNKGVSLGLSVYVKLFRLDYAVIFDNFSKDNISHDIGMSFIF